MTISYMFFFSISCASVQEIACYIIILGFISDFTSQFNHDTFQFHMPLSLPQAGDDLRPSFWIEYSVLGKL